MEGWPFPALGLLGLGCYKIFGGVASYEAREGDAGGCMGRECGSEVDRGRKLY